MRGWGPESFKRARPEFMDAVRWGLYLEKAVPLLERWREVEAMTVDKDTPNLAAIIGQKNAAAQVIPLLTSLVYPEDPDG